MICKKCGAQINDTDAFCPNCGSAVQHDTSDMIFCQKCGSPMNKDAMFCPTCGTPVAEKPKDKNKPAIIAVIVILSIALISAVVALGISSSRSKTADAEATPTAEVVTEAPTASPVPTAQPAAEKKAEQPQKAEPQSLAGVSDGYYNPALTYKRMSEIHKSTPADSGTFNTVYNIIYAFDAACEAYMNDNSDVPPQLLKGSTAYNQQTSYKQKHPTLYQTYEQIDVLNVRQYGNYYYAWVTERLSQTENDLTEVTTDHWVYKLVNNNGSISIMDYTSDPAY